MLMKNSLDKINELEDIAAKILKAKKIARPRRPIVIEFCGTPKAGKTSCVSSLNLFLKRNGFKTKVLTERASICPIKDKYNPSFNLWNLFSSSAELLENFIEKSKEVDVILCDRSIFDCLCWFQWFKKYDHINNKDFAILENFLTMDRYITMFDLIYVFKTSPKVALEREYTNLLTRKSGTIMNMKVLSDYNSCIEVATKKYKGTFRSIKEINTDNLSQNEVSLKVTNDVLASLIDLTIEKVAYVSRSSLSNFENKNFWFDDKLITKLKVSFEYRNLVEKNSEFIQPIPIMVLTDKNKNRVLVARKKDSSLGENSPEKDKLVSYFGGHIRIEDNISHIDFEQTIFSALTREIQEELGITLNIASNNSSPLFIWLKDNEKSAKHLAICFLYQADFEHHKIKLDDYEFIQKTGASESGRIFDLKELQFEKFEKWSRIILSELLEQKGSEYQLDIFDK
jgi:predicted NUDIX family phosphoesterase/thymidylate kinase